MNVILEPNPGSQLLFVTAPFREVLYHGTRGPGKTLALLMDFGKDTGRGWGLKWRGVLFRESYPQLADVVTKSKEWFPRIYPQAKFNKSNYTWTWPDGEELLFRHMARPEDYWSYHGHEYPWIGWEELTNWPTGECYDMMMATNRCSMQGVPKRVRSTCNPWGAGHHWVKSLFIDQAPP
ncbi:MAG: terminase, partial [Ketobacter sp.]|nr:terminase [Ketobacter sp.]